MSSLWALLLSCVFCNVLDPAARFAISALPNVSFPLPKSYAGQIGVPGKPNNALFFWLWEADDLYADNFIIWLNGGPGCSSLEGMTKENGPIQFYDNQTIPAPNPYSWSKFGNVLYLDQPVGVGYSSGNRPPRNNAEVTEDFVAWLNAFYQTFPRYRARKLFLAGESWAGTYIPYFAQALLRDTSVNLQAISIGDGTIANPAALTDAVTTTMMIHHNDTLQIPSNVLSLFQSADRKCGFDRTLSQIQYPPKGPISLYSNPEGRALVKRQNDDGCHEDLGSLQRIQDSLDTCGGGCATASTALAYMRYRTPRFNAYNVKKPAPSLTQFQTYLNQESVRKAIHAPNLTYSVCSDSLLDVLADEAVEPAAYQVIPGIVARGVKVLLYSGEYDFLLNPFGAELAIQNMTWGGLQGFQQCPQQPLIVNGRSMGVWGQERGLGYFRFFQAGHLVPLDQPAAALAYVGEFLIRALRS